MIEKKTKKEKKLTDVSFFYMGYFKNELLSLSTLSSNVPDIKMDDSNDLLNLKNVITEAHLKLIEMFTI